MSKTIIIHPTSESKFEAISSFLKAFDVKFETTKTEDLPKHILELDNKSKPSKTYQTQDESNLELENFVNERLDAYL